ncbi:MAG: AAA family ATPase [Candidatus Pacebacteria bacterium]|nr:AAA family ATPase [Candidatus Paceibacterota bacterium]
MDDNRQYNRGSEWRKWDLHVHTPFSHTSEYAGATPEEKWDNFIEGLESLPEDMKVIGINDYLFLDGYKEVLKYKNDGRLKNIDLILPVVEFRLKEFVGNEQLKKINYHVIFAEQSLLDTDTIEAQFLSCFRSSCNLEVDDVGGATWGGVVTKESLIDLGKHIYETTPEDKRESDNHFEIGFKNISYSLDKLKECLGEIKEPNTYLKGKYIKAIGKSEWEDFRWTGSPADKKDIINNAHIVFSASPNADQANKNIGSLKDQSANGRLLHCSDAHTIKQIEDEGVVRFDFSNTSPKDLGHCFTWIKGSTSFETLRQVVVDYENRVLIQERNPAENKNSSPELFIEKMEYKQDGETHTVYFNKDINSVIGKRGAGKSVLLKHIVFDVLEKGVKEIKKLNEFKIYWCDNTSENKFIEYIPQNYLSAITYEDGEKYDERDEMLKARLFNNDLFKNADTSKNEAIDSIELKINAKVKEAISLHRQIVDTTSQLKPLGKVEDKDKAIKTKQEEINNLGKIDITDEDIKNQTKYSSEIDSLSGDIKLLEQDVQIIKNINKDKDASFITVDDEAFFGLSQTTLELIEKHIEKLSSQEIKAYLDNLLTDLTKKIKTKKKGKSTVEKKLKPINEKLQQNKTIEKILKEISKLDVEKKEIEKLNKFVQESNEKKVVLISEVADLYLSFKDKIEGIIQTLKNEFSNFTFITFDFMVGYDVNAYKSRFFDVYIDGRSGDRFKKFIDGNRDFNKMELIEIIKDIIADADTAKLKTTGGDKERALVALLSCRYDIDFTKSVKYKNGDGLVDFENMTGGQKAMALLDLIFNLSKSGYPIIIDQPENDIDVSGISNDLRRLVLDQKERRQIIVATHSPNLLLLTDSENVIIAENENNIIHYRNGGIEDKKIQDDIVNILEGGRDALKKRMQKIGVNR